MRVYSRTLNVSKFEKDFSSLIRLREDKETVINDVVARVNAVKADIVTFLRNVDEIEDEEVQKYCRSAAIAQMYNVKTKSSGGYPYIAQQNKWVLLIVFRHDRDEDPGYFTSTAVVSKYGEIIIQERVLDYVRPNSTYFTRGWIIKSVMNGKYGFVSDYGELLIPCFFDNQYQHGTGESMFFYRNICFELTVYGKRSKLEKEVFESLLNLSEREADDDYEFLICRSKDGVLFYLRALDDLIDSNGQIVYNAKFPDGTPTSRVDPTTYREARKEVKAFMSQFIVSHEELKQIVGKRSCGYELCDDKCIIYECPEIKDKQFRNHSFSEVELPNTLECIGERAFYECKNLKSIRIPKSVTRIGECAFGFCRNLESIEVEEGNPNYRSERNCLLASDGKTLFCGCRSSKIPNSVEHIDDNAFYACGLTAIVIPSGVATIGKNAFWGCAITSIKIPPSVTTIGEDAFAACRDLKSIEIPDSIKDYSALQECKVYLRDIYLPSGGPMNYRGFEWQTPSAPWLRGVDRMIKQKITLHVPAGTEEEYRKDSFFGTFGAIVTIA